MEHARENGMSADLSQCSVRSYKQGKNSQETLTTEENTLTTKELRMMPSCDWHQNYAHRFPSVSVYFSLSFCVPKYQFTCCQCTKLIHFLTCTRIPCRGSHLESGRVRCCIYMSANWAENLGRSLRNLS